ncbi:hypothetical protein A3D00_01125 [Candidatus Woesebacteria bacterium RIFCSPHIGHO2_02_FULL_38_9]|uniref:RRM domain-containing protein n=1 Tax=Candidatus Woesebacteria bacterium RIFCSPHIGHO2_01_FULL_39_28 TaxID=1802496 RepID=A0A1F7YJC0_9BACT|nr:MAG: hypothetical protein A2627_01270 [Candidatus Woesebacteria bacterium RIFCSPHIGHO2_01_FULL_39_28]OGM31725.1 MAG: hypothetical protein A3D00_01125 [Candidatus Woesebacteria bacterium RIFCSPHIGHO2_02_FULL_38_9]OGM57666.1 MAG: hypothetical protein A3A50_01500 [Candidatus Woesebacteria bacterium RIFCSPLOWO2_01_FULL_38_20]
MTRLFVGNLPYTVTTQDITDMFTPLVKISSVNLITDKFTGRSKGFAFVDVDDDKEAQNAIEKLNNSVVQDRNIVVSVAKPREERPAGPSYGGGFRNDRRGGGDRRDFRRGDNRSRR